jgi:uncharacterized protein YndB with AHSA1/START domain
MAMTSSAAAAPPDREIVVARVFDAPRRMVFRAWTDPELAVHWWGPRGFAPVSCEMDVRPGGEWRRSMRSPEGSLRCARGVYREIVAPERLVFTYAWDDADGRPGHETLVTVTFAEIGGRTELILRQSAFQSVTAADAHRGGWTSCFERFAEYLATLSPQDGDRRCSTRS